MNFQKTLTTHLLLMETDLDTATATFDRATNNGRV